jgi:uncharacterized protein YndB with AHSA1/START domain
MKKVEVSIETSVSPEKVIEAFMDADMLRGWWGVERSLIEKRAGGAYTIAWQISKEGFGYVSTGVVQQYDPSGLLEIGHFTYLNPERDILGPMTLKVTATVEAGKTQVQLCQDGYQEGADWDWYYVAVQQAWPVVIGQLKAWLEK